MKIYIERDLTLPGGAFSQNCISTDVAISLAEWSAMNASRAYGSIVQRRNRVYVDVNWSLNDSFSWDILFTTFCKNGLKIVESVEEP